MLTHESANEQEHDENDTEGSKESNEFTEHLIKHKNDFSKLFGPLEHYNRENTKLNYNDRHYVIEVQNTIDTCWSFQSKDLVDFKVQVCIPVS